MFGKTIMASVGLGGLNRPADVMTVQYLLNCVHVSYGGPIRELVVDGIVGPETAQAIQRFQKVRFGKSDGRVDPKVFGGMTMRALEVYDPYPGEQLPICAGWSKKHGKHK